MVEVVRNGRERAFPLPRGNRPPIHWLDRSLSGLAATGGEPHGGPDDRAFGCRHPRTGERLTGAVRPVCRATRGARSRQESTGSFRPGAFSHERQQSGRLSPDPASVWMPGSPASASRSSRALKQNCPIDPSADRSLGSLWPRIVDTHKAPCAYEVEDLAGSVASRRTKRRWASAQFTAICCVDHPPPSAATMLIAAVWRLSDTCINARRALSADACAVTTSV